MKRFDGVVLCSDIDGTLVDEHNIVPKENLEAIEYFRAHGGKFTLATGRIPEAVIPILRGITLDFPCVCHNGCSIYDFGAECYVETVELSRDSLAVEKEIEQMTPESGIEVVVPSGIFVIKRTYATDRHLEFERISASYAQGLEAVTEPWLKILFAQEPNQTEYIKEKMSNSAYHEKYSMLQTHQYYYEILNKNASKGNALSNLCRRFGIDLKNVAAIGDNENDISMLSIVGVSAAAGNASNNVREKADMVTCTNNHGAVADFISKL